MQHKWHKEIKAWADGAEIEESLFCEVAHGDYDWSAWRRSYYPEWELEEYMYRIKPQPKEPQYLLVILLNDGQTILGRSSEIIPLGKGQSVNKIIGKIKLEVDDD